MNKNRFALITLLAVSFLLLACGEKSASATSGAQATAPAAAAAQGPQITLSLARVPQGGITKMHGTGFTPHADVESHLKRPNGTEFNVLPMYTDEKGEFNHEIESFLLQIGTHEVWVVDTTTGRTSNIAKFETTRDQIPLAK